MTKDVVILVGEDDEGHFELIRKNLLRAGVSNEMHRLANGQEILDFFLTMSKRPKQKHNGQKYILLLDIRIPKVDGVEVLEKIKQDKIFLKLPVIILTVADGPHTIEQCYNLGCNTYIVKPTEHEDFEETIQKIGRFLSVVEVASVK